MSSQTPQVGQFSPDGQFRWDGREWMPVARGYREPTTWTRPMQLVTAGFLVLGVLNSVIADVLFFRVDTVIRVAKAQNPSLPDDTVRQVANFGMVVGWTTLAVVSLVVLLLALGSLLGWRWIFWFNLVWLGLSTIGALTNLIALGANPVTQQMPRGAIGVNLVLSFAAFGLLIWYIVGLAQFGPWAMRRPGR